MALPTDIAAGSTGHVAHHNWLHRHGGAQPTQRHFSEWWQSGDDDDMTVNRIIADVEAMPYKTEVLLAEQRQYNITDLHEFGHGFALAGAARPAQDQARSSKPFPNVLRLAGGGGFVPKYSQTFGGSFRNLSLDGDSSSSLVYGHPSRVLWTTLFRDISAQNLGCVVGSPSGQKLLDTACTFDGAWNINNIRYRAFNLGGSDTKFAFSQILIDSPGNTLIADSAYLVRFDSQQKSPIKNLYLTADRHSGVECLYSGDFMHMSDSILEGRNENTPCFGSLIRGSGDNVWAFTDCFFGYAMTNPALTGRNDGGYIHWQGGSVRISGCQFKLAATAQYGGRTFSGRSTPPIAYFDGGRHIVNQIQTRDGFPGKPRVVLANGATCEADGTVELTNASGQTINGSGQVI